MIRHFLNSWFIKEQNERISVNKNEQKELLKIVLEAARSSIKHYSIPDPSNQYIDLMLTPTMIDEALEMLKDQSIGARSLLIEYPIVKHKKPRKGRL